MPADIASVIHDYREFDRAVGLAYEFYRKYPRETLIIVASDHESGGLGLTLALKDLSSSKARTRSRGAAGFQKNPRDRHFVAKSRANARHRPQERGHRQTHAPNTSQGLVSRRNSREKIVKQPIISRTIFAEPVANALGMMVANNTQIYWQIPPIPMFRS